MQLLDLPLELFELIADELIGYFGPAQAVKLRLVCKTFATVIQLKALTRDALRDTIYASQHKQRQRQHLLETYGATILQAQVLTVFNSLTTFISSTVDGVMAARQVTSAELRDAYVHSICRAVCVSGIDETDFLLYLFGPDPSPRTNEGNNTGGQDYSDDVNLMPGDPHQGHSSNEQHKLGVAAASVGDLEYLQSLVMEPSALYQATIMYFPSVLHAAVVNQNTEVVHWVLNHPDLETTQRSDDPDTVNKYIEALGIAIELAARTMQTHLGLTIAEHCLNVQHERGIMSHCWLDQAISCAGLHGDGKLFFALTACRVRLESHWHHYLIANGLGVDSFRFLRDMSRSTMLYLLRKGYVDPNHFGHEIPVQLALEARRYDLAKLFLDFGANLDARSYGGMGRTALERELSGPGSICNVRFLVENGSHPLDVRNDQMKGTTRARTLINKTIAFASDNNASTITQGDWQVFWYTERRGLLKDTWNTYERITANLNNIPYI